MSLRAYFLVVGLIPTLGLAACKARKGAAGSVVKEDGAEGSPQPASVEAFLTHLDRDAAIVEQSFEISGERGPSETAYALADADSKAEALALARELHLMAQDNVLRESARIATMALELEALGQLLGTELTDAERQNIQAAIVRVRYIIANPPPPPAPPPPPLTADSELECRGFPGGDFLPFIKQNSQQIGVRGNAGKGFSTQALCLGAVEYRNRGLVCSMTASGYVSPHKIPSGTAIGPATGFAQAQNCNNAVWRSTASFICLVDNSTSGNGRYVRINPSNGAEIDWWFDDFDKCLSGQKGPDPRTVCREGCESGYTRCMNRNYNESGSIEDTQHRTGCLLDKIQCRQGC